METEFSYKENTTFKSKLYAFKLTYNCCYDFILAQSKVDFQKHDKNGFIETKAYIEAKNKLNESKFLILSGNPGEGKSSMAKHLILSKFPVERCLFIRGPFDWEHVDLSVVVEKFDAIVVDDIFGVGVFEKSLFDYWRERMDAVLQNAKEHKVCSHLDKQVLHT